MTVQDEAAEVVTELWYSPFSGSPEREKIAPGAAVYKNALGGIVCTAAYHLKLGLSQFNKLRKAWLIALLDKLNGGCFPFIVRNEQNFSVLTRKRGNGPTLLTVFTLNFDPVKTLFVRCAAEPGKVEKLGGDGV